MSLDLGFDLPAGAGASVIPAAERPREFHEEFTGTESWIWIEETHPLPASGTYYFVAYLTGAVSDGDKLWMAIGTREVFGLADILGIFSVRAFVREFHELK